MNRIISIFSKKTLNLTVFCLIILCAKINFSLANEVIFENRTKEIKKGKKPLSYELFAHPNLGCPENSLCSKEMGKHNKAWRDLLKSITARNFNEKKAVEEIEKFRSSNGIPVKLLVSENKKAIDFHILWDSDCKHHRGVNKVYKSRSFISSTKDKSLQLHKKEMKNKSSDFISYELDKVIIHNGDNKQTYLVPHGETPMYSYGDSLYFMREDEGIYYGLKIKNDGDWKVVHIRHKNNRYFAGQDETKCPEKIKFSSKFKNSYCKKIWDIKLKKFLIAQYPWSC
jgi:hypothetical protein